MTEVYTQSGQLPHLAFTPEPNIMEFLLCNTLLMLFLLRYTRTCVKCSGHFQPLSNITSLLHFTGLKTIFMENLPS